MAGANKIVTTLNVIGIMVIVKKLKIPAISPIMLQIILMGQIRLAILPYAPLIG
jgi:hypothetical protein